MEQGRAGSTESRVCRTMRDWQGKVSFEKTLGSAAVSTWGQLTLPARLWQQHGDKIQNFVVLESVADRKLWTVEVHIYFPQKRPQVVFYGGWRLFVVANGLVKGDRLTFTLTGRSKFEVSILRSGGDPKMPSVQRPKLRLKDSEFSKGQPKKSLGRQYIDVTGKSCVKSERELNGLLAIKGPAEDSIAHFDSNIYKSIGSPSDSHFFESSERPSDMDSHFFEPMVQQIEQEARSKTFNDAGLDAQSQNALHPRFSKRITGSNALEIPCGFMKSHWTQIGTHVKLQGIHEGSRMHNVMCTSVIDGGRPRLFFKSSCWKFFVKDNCLRTGHRLIFILTADSFFVVRNAE